jgi:predicted DNA binding protein
MSTWWFYGRIHDKWVPCFFMEGYRKLIYHLSFHKNTRYSFIIYSPITTQGTHLSFILPWNTWNSFIVPLNSRNSFIIYPSIKTSGTHLSFILPKKHEVLIYQLSYHNNTRNTSIIYLPIKLEKHIDHLSFHENTWHL